MKIISTSKVQKNIWILSDTKNIYTFINNGEPKTMLIPYSEGLQEYIEEYVENIEMLKTRQNLIAEWRASLESGISELTI